MAEVCEEELAKLQVELEQLEAEINPALDDNALVAFSYVLGKTVDCMKAVPDVSYSLLLPCLTSSSPLSPLVMAIPPSCVLQEDS